ncbi:hypothetical protein BC834DRAFT_503224 [Gloeopeniophorella convolvens]|nr:hypothetical protein BC834DRAFT_503224 [Gloeopeniophorella convolvens]
MMHQFDVTENTLRQYTSHGDSILLANLLCFVRRSLFVSPRYIDAGDLEQITGDKPILMRDTLPELQRQFCEVWNGVVDLAKRQFGDSSESEDRRQTSLEALDFMRHLFISLHPELAFPFDLRRTKPFDWPELPDILPTLPSCPDPACHTVRAQRPDTHNRQSHHSHGNPTSSSASNAVSPPSDEGTTDAQATPCSQPATPSASSLSTTREPSATLLIGSASPGSGAPMVDASAPSHASGNATEPSRSSPIASSMIQQEEVLMASLLHRA